MNAAKDMGEEFYDPAREDNISGKEKEKTRLELWEEHLKDPIISLDQALKCPENISIRVVLWLEVLAKSHANCHGFAVGWARHFAKHMGKTVLRRRLASLGPVPTIGTLQGSMMASSFSSFSRRSRSWLRTTCRPNPFVSAETLKACALIGLHFLQQEVKLGLVVVNLRN